MFYCKNIRNKTFLVIFLTKKVSKTEEKVIFKSSEGPEREKFEAKEEGSEGLYKMLIFDIQKRIKKFKKRYLLAKNTIQHTDFNEVKRNAALTTRKIIFPTEVEIETAPLLNRWIVGKLVLSLMLDFIGFAAFFVPIFGWIFNLFWAPISSFFVHKMYVNEFFTSLNFVEELLPIWDFIPSASLAWVYTYYESFSPWCVRGFRFVSMQLMQRQEAGNLQVKFQGVKEKVNKQLERPEVQQVQEKFGEVMQKPQVQELKKKFEEMTENAKNGVKSAPNKDTTDNTEENFVPVEKESVYNDNLKTTGLHERRIPHRFGEVH